MQNNNPTNIISTSLSLSHKRNNINKNNSIEIVGSILALKHINYINLVLLRKNQQYRFMVDIDDYNNFLKNYVWSAALHMNDSKYIYAFGWENNKRIALHRFILEKNGFDITNKVVDHINRNTLDNRKINLRSCNVLQNNVNSKSEIPSQSSLFKGVHLERKTNKWRARLQTNKLNISLGTYDNEIDAAEAYNHKAKELWGEFAYQNKQ